MSECVWLTRVAKTYGFGTSTRIYGTRSDAMRRLVSERLRLGHQVPYGFETSVDPSVGIVRQVWLYRGATCELQRYEVLT